MAVELSRREFGMADQLRFASFSGDYNPIHIDSVHARHTQAGAPVAHGIHVLLWALDSLSGAYPNLPPMKALRANFKRFVYLDQQVQLSAAEGLLGESVSSRVRLVISVDESPRATFTIQFGNADERYPGWSAARLDEVAFSAKPFDLEFEKLSVGTGRLDLAMSASTALHVFPAASKWLGALCVAAMAASSRLVGMVCPGLNSFYRELRISACGKRAGAGDGSAMTVCTGAAYADACHDDTLAFRVSNADPRFRSLQLQIAGGGVAGTVVSDARTPRAPVVPPNQVSDSDIK
jgi:hypothetical protein